MYWANNQRLSFFSILFLLLYFIKEILSLGIRTDITMETKDTIYVIELKFNKSAQEALDQINNKHYADAFALRGKTVEKIGMNFMIDEDKTLVLDWWKFGEWQQKRCPSKRR